VNTVTNPIGLKGGGTGEGVGGENKGVQRRTIASEWKTQIITLGWTEGGGDGKKTCELPEKTGMITVSRRGQPGVKGISVEGDRHHRKA